MNLLPVAQPIHPDRHTRSAAAQFRARWLRPSTTVISVVGELDATNGHAFADYVLAHVPRANQLVLDLSGVKFFGTTAFSAMQTISMRTAGDGVGWALVPSREVTRLLVICDPDRALPTYGDLDTAMSALNRAYGYQLPQLVTKAR